jgi:hypothetical protein
MFFNELITDSNVLKIHKKLNCSFQIRKELQLLIENCDYI